MNTDRSDAFPLYDRPSQTPQRCRILSHILQVFLNLYRYLLFIFFNEHRQFEYQIQQTNTLVQVLPEKEKKAAADELHLQALLDVAVEELQQLGNVRKRQHQQRNLQLTGDHRECVFNGQNNACW